jgi:flagellar basal-body rod protein FlgB
MSDSLISDVTLQTLNRALDGLSRRQQVISGNLANVDTPGYHASTVDFETALQRAEGADGRLRLEVTRAGHLAAPNANGMDAAQLVARTGGSTRADGNNVNVDQELMELSATGIEYQALTQLVSKKMLLLKSIATGR